MTLKDYYSGLPMKVDITPRQKLINRIAEITGCSKVSAMKYCRGIIVPIRIIQEKIAEELNTPISELFPNEAN